MAIRRLRSSTSAPGAPGVSLCAFGWLRDVVAAGLRLEEDRNHFRRPVGAVRRLPTHRRADLLTQKTQADRRQDGHEAELRFGVLGIAQGQLALDPIFDEAQETCEYIVTISGATVRDGTTRASSRTASILAELRQGALEPRLASDASRT